MYIPGYFTETNMDAVRDFIRANGFAILVNEVNNRPWATHVPLMLCAGADNKDVLTGHMARANEQWKTFDSDKEILAVFQGPHAYISPSWYDHESVPTWNYTAVHVYGKIKIIEGTALRQHLESLMSSYEAGVVHPVSFSNVSESYVEKLIRELVAFEIEITEIQAVAKLSQNKDDKNRKNIIDELTKRGDAGSVATAALMSHRYDKS